MTRNLRTLGVALSVAFALSAVAASVASAQGEQGLLTAPKFSPMTLRAEEIGGEGANSLTAFGVKMECPGSTYTGHKYNVTPHAFILTGATNITLTPHYKQESCVVSKILRMTVQTNGCDFAVHLGETSPAGNNERTYAVTTDIICPVEKELTMKAYTTEPKHEKGESFCELHIKSQAGLKGAHATDTGNGYVDIGGQIEGAHVLRTGTADPLLCPEGTTTTGKFDIDFTIEGHNEGGEPVAISISE